MNIFLDSWLWFAAVILIGICIGSFLALVVYRLPKMIQLEWETEVGDLKNEELPANLSLCTPRSHCPHCTKPLQWRYNIPLISFILLKGRCAYCNHRIDPRYFLIELTTAIVWLSIAYIYGLTIHFAVAVLASSCLIALAFIDQKEKILPDEITLPLLWFGLLINSFGLFASPQDAIYGAIGGYLILFFIQQAFVLVKKRQGMGQGDLKLLSAIGALLGWQALPGILLIASLSGILISCILIFSKQLGRNQEIPFGPYLSLAGFIGLLFPNIVHNPFTYIGLM